MKKQELFVVLKNIRYSHPDHELGGKLITPDMKAAKVGLPMDHLSEPDLSLLLKKRVITPKPAEVAKAK